jgi:hypothetical protein
MNGITRLLDRFVLVFTFGFCTSTQRIDTVAQLLLSSLHDGKDRLNALEAKSKVSF